MLQINNSSFCYGSGWRQGLLALVLSLWIQSVSAVNVEDLYVAEVLVNSQDDAQLVNGARAGLLQVLVRVSGSRAIEGSPQVTASLQHPESYYYQYSFESTDRMLQIGDEQVPARILRLTFEPSAIARLLRQAGFPVWGSNRPSVLAWLAVSDGSSRRLLSEQDTSQLPSALNTHAKFRGVPVLYPLLDLEDASQLSSAEVWGAFLGRVEQASARYKPDVVLSGRIQQDPMGRWLGFWSYQLDDNWREFDNSGFSEDELMADMVDHLVDDLAARYALDSSRGSILVSVDGIDDLDDYAQVSQYLESLAPVLNSAVVAVSGRELRLRLVTEGQSQQLIEIIQLDDKMLLVSDGSLIRGDGALHYRWLL
ncbi:DUF2066 domain-containing protein [Pseudomonadales bacterium]|nr:DUF2066 domain-containing protein [Pseudomonadales bacterium]MDA9285667.1 DUF2066 domain-containing protein [Pseudomonadales bacterium]MDA9297485.1 DUF2066 domain-containing protein [Pseudomonadales bacterium]MDB4150523.1 DUF2066 domain-containing protein [Pseudomonadales bacterium]MDB9868908.1 DUF2066 domain-containing protein [Pseudomonadales bacterium]